MYEAFAEISNEFKDFDKQVNFFDYILKDKIEIWTSKNMSEYISKEVLILKTFHIVKEENENLLIQLQAFWSKIPLILHVLSSISSRTPPIDVNFLLNFFLEIFISQG
jgi:hypothetical protein